MTAEQRGAYIQLIAFCWASGDASLPDDDETLARLSGVNEGWLKGGCQLVRDCFEPHPQKTGALTQSKVYEEWQKMIAWSEKSKEGGRKSGQARRKRRTNHPSTTVEPPYEPNGNQIATIGSGSGSVSTSSVKQKKKAKGFTPPTVSEVRAYCAERANQLDSGTFVDYYLAQGWKLANGRAMKDWKAAVRTWEKRAQKPTRPRVARISELGLTEAAKRD